MSRVSRRAMFVLLLVATLIAGCGPTDLSPSATPSPSVPALNNPSSAAVEQSATPSQAPTPTTAPTPADPFLGHVVVTVSDSLRVRSQPRVSDDSVKYEPLLPLGTELQVIDGPVNASSYTWYKVVPVSFSLRDGPGSGWVAMAGKDGEAWIALAGGPLAEIDLAHSSLARASVDPASAGTAATSINAFGLDLLRAMLTQGTLKPDENAVFSPTSITLALAMARAGAKGETASQMDAVLHTPGWDELGTGLNALEQALAQRNGSWQDEGLYPPPTRELAVRIANASFAQKDWTIEDEYLDRIASTFGAGVRLVDYRTDYEAARKLINAWVSDQTKQRIPELIPRGILDDLTRLVLVNAIYLKATWELEFDESLTRPRPFTRLDGSPVDVQTMHQVGAQTIPYARGTGWQATDLRYLGPDYGRPLAMTLILPDDLRSFESRLTASQLGRITATLESEREGLGVITPGTTGEMCDMGTYPYEVSLYLPRFGIDTKAPLADLLGSLGMPLAFTRGVADFSAMHVPTTVAERLYISDVIHQANIDVDENGTEAAAATAVIMGDTGGGCVGDVPSPRKTIILRLDHPFLFVLRDVETGAVLFMGRVVDPSVGRTGS